MLTILPVHHRGEGASPALRSYTAWSVMARGDRGCLCRITLITSSTMAGVTTGQLCLGMGDPLSARPAVNSLMYWLMLLRPISLMRVCLLRSEGTSRAYQESRSPDPASSGTSRQGRSQVRDSPSSGHQLASPSVSLKFPHGRLFVLSFFWCRPGLLARQQYEPHPRHIPTRVRPTTTASHAGISAPSTNPRILEIRSSNGQLVSHGFRRTLSSWVKMSLTYPGKWGLAEVNSRLSIVHDTGVNSSKEKSPSSEGTWLLGGDDLRLLRP